MNVGVKYFPLNKLQDYHSWVTLGTTVVTLNLSESLKFWLVKF